MEARARRGARGPGGQGRVRRTAPRVPPDAPKRPPNGLERCPNRRPCGPGPKGAGVGEAPEGASADDDRREPENLRTPAKTFRKAPKAFRKPSKTSENPAKTFRRVQVCPLRKRLILTAGSDPGSPSPAPLPAAPPEAPKADNPRRPRPTSEASEGRERRRRPARAWALEPRPSSLEGRRADLGTRGLPRGQSVLNPGPAFRRPPGAPRAGPPEMAEADERGLRGSEPEDSSSSRACFWRPRGPGQRREKTP